METIIRDHLVDIARENGNPITYRVTHNTEERVHFLLEKIREEKLEFNSAGPKTKHEEAGDVLEAIEAIIDELHHLGEWTAMQQYVHMREDFLEKCERSGINMEAVYTVKSLKREEKGGFENGIIATLEKKKK